MRAALLVLSTFIGLLGALFLPFSNPIGHRYFLAIYLVALLVAVGIVELGGWNWKGKLALATVMLGLVSGHLWVYPRGIAQGWDGSLAHLPIFQMQTKLDLYLQEQSIERSEICSDFPLLPDPYIAQVLPSRSAGSFRDFFEATDCHWAVTSRLNNGYSEQQTNDFERSGKWILRHGDAFGPIYLRLYEHR